MHLYPTNKPIGLKTIFDHKNRILRTLDYIEAHLDESLSVKRLSKVACLSDFHFHRRFAHYVGETVSGYVRSRRLMWASKKLVTTEETITALALLVGYNTPEAFSKAFKKAFGISPSKFRKDISRKTFKGAVKTATPILLIPCCEKKSQIKDTSDIDKESILDFMRMGDQIDIENVASSWVSVFPYFYVREEDVVLYESTYKINSGSLDFHLVFPGKEARFHVLNSGQTAVFDYRNMYIPFRKIDTVRSFPFEDPPKHLSQLPMHIRSFLCISHRFSQLLF